MERLRQTGVDTHLIGRVQGFRKFTFPFGVGEEVVGDVLLGGHGPFQRVVPFGGEDVTVVGTFGAVVHNALHYQGGFLFFDNAHHLVDKVFGVGLIKG